MAVDFSAYLDKSVGDIQAPKAKPAGHYFGRIKDWTPKESGEGKPMLILAVTLDSAGDDVDLTALPPQGVANQVVRRNYMLDSDFGQFQIKEALEAAGVEMDPAQGIGQYLEPSKGLPVKVYIETRTHEGREYDDVKKVMAA